MLKQLVLNLVFLFVCSSVFAETLFVSQLGAGAKNGLSVETAWDVASLSWGSGDGKIGAGDTLYLLDTITSMVRIGGSGSSGSQIIIRGDYPEHDAVLYGGETSVTLGMIYGYSRSYVTLQNFTVNDSTGYSVLFDTAGTGIILDGLTINDSHEFPIYIKNIIGPEVKNCLINRANMGGDNHGEAIRYSNVTGGSIHDNEIDTGRNSGIDLYGGTSGVRVYKNVVHDLTEAGSAVPIYCDNADNNFIYQNEVYNSTYSCGIEVGSETDGQDSSGNWIYNNYIHNNRGGLCAGNSFGTGHVRSSGNFWMNNTVTNSGTYSSMFFQSGSQNETVWNNALYQAGSDMLVVMQGTTGLVMDYNAYWRTDGSAWIFNIGGIKSFAQIQVLGYEAHGINANPLLSGVNAYPPSPLITTGKDLSAYFTEDYYSDPRRGDWDIGADSYDDFYKVIIGSATLGSMN